MSDQRDEFSEKRSRPDAEDPTNLLPNSDSEFPTWWIGICQLKGVPEYYSI